MGNPEIEERTGVTFDFNAPLIQLFGSLHISFFKLLCTLFEILYSSDLCGVRSS